MRTTFFLAILSLALLTGGILAFSPSDTRPLVLIKTNKGDITVMLYNETPIHRDNFLKLAREGFYEGRIFHRVMNNFMIQAGWTPQGVDDPDYRLDAEIVEGLFHKKGALAAARQGDNVNPQRKSSGCQFYIVHGQPFQDHQLDNFQQRTGHTYTEEQRQVYKTQGGAPHLDGSYTIFGEVIKGMDVVDQIAAVETGQGNRPAKDIVILKMEVLEE